MAQIISFFSKQAIISDDGDYVYSEVYEVVGGANFAAQLRLLSSSTGASSLTGILEGCTTPTITPIDVWSQVGTNMVVNNPPDMEYQTLSNLPRFIRAKLVGAVGVTFIASFDGVLR